MYIEVGKRISKIELSAMGNTLAQTKAMRAMYVDNLREIHRRFATVKELSPIVYDRYIYKGRDIEVKAKKSLKVLLTCREQIHGFDHINKFMVLDEAGQGELALLLALIYPEATIYCDIRISESKDILKGCVDNFVRNIHIVDRLSIDDFSQEGTKAYAVISRSSSKEGYNEIPQTTFITLD